MKINVLGNKLLSVSYLFPRFVFICLMFELVGIFSSCLLAGDKPVDKDSSRKKAHVWQCITFPSPKNGDKNSPYFSVRCGEKGQGLQLNIDADASDTKREAPAILLQKPIAAHLYRENGEIINSVGGNLDRPRGMSDMGSTGWSISTIFPWGKNTLDAAWIKVDLGTERYWLEIPYGFDRNPQVPLPPAQSDAGPKIIPAMKALTNHDHVLQWKGVVYDLGKIQNGWSLSLIQSNPGDGESEVELYRDDEAIGKSMYLWDMYSPRTKVYAIDSDGTRIQSHGVNIHLDEDGFRRRDLFKMNRYISDVDNRCWGQIEIKVDDKSYRVVVPSSLYKFIHGHPPIK